LPTHKTGHDRHDSGNDGENGPLPRLTHLAGCAGRFVHSVKVLDEIRPCGGHLLPQPRLQTIQVTSGRRGRGTLAQTPHHSAATLVAT
jgi:hypothetical protein